MPKIRPSVLALGEWMFEIRRDIHRHPELGYEEKRTSGLVARELRALGYDVKTGLGRTGVAGLRRFSPAGRVLGLRADMDALPVVESPKNFCRSEIEGLMHACGHDLHIATLLGAARVLARDEALGRSLRGAVKVIFQPAEEGGRGALAMINDGVLQNPALDAIFAAHVAPQLETGLIGYTPGVAMAAVDNFTIHFQGRGGHAAHPKYAQDPIAPAAEFVNRLKKAAAPLDRALLAICTFHAGTKSNIIPDQAVITGTLRALSEPHHEKLLAILSKTVEDFAREKSLEVKLNLEKGYPMLVNDDRMLAVLKQAAGLAVGPANVVEHAPSFGAEDMAYFLKEVPGVNYNLGCRKPGGPVTMIHSSEFDPNEEAMLVGVEVMIRLAEALLA
ncbi:MAG: M20 family metallopeptidase [Pseudomonadota bacterium]